jgi:hypothetical protein
MTDFWNFEQAAGGEFDAGGGDLSPIPADTQCIAAIDEAQWRQDLNNNTYLSLRWSILQPAEYNNRKVYQKLWVKDPDPKAKDPAKKKEKAMRMFGAIDFNAGGKLRALGGEPTDEAMTLHLCGKPMLIKVMQWKIDDPTTGDTKTGNWIGAVSPKNGAKPMPAKPVTKPVVVEDAPF